MNDVVECLVVVDDERQDDAAPTWNTKTTTKMARFDVPEEASRSTATSADGVLDEGRVGRTTVSIATAAQTDQLLNKTLTYDNRVDGPGVDEDDG